MRHESELAAVAVDEVGVRRAADSQAAAFGRLADQHLESSYRLARAILRDTAAAEDATHDAFVQAWRHWAELRDPSRFEQWFTRILVNTCRNHLKRAGRAPIRDISAEIRARGDEIGRADDRQAVGAAIAQLPADHQLVLALRYFRDMTVNDIAAQLGIPAGTVHSRIHYALKRMAAVLGDGSRGAGR